MLITGKRQQSNPQLAELLRRMEAQTEQRKPEATKQQPIVVEASAPQVNIAAPTPVEWVHTIEYNKNGKPYKIHSRPIPIIK